MVIQTVWYNGKFNFTETEQDLMNCRAAELMAELHNRLMNAGYSGHELDDCLLRIFLCLLDHQTAPDGKQRFLPFLNEQTPVDSKAEDLLLECSKLDWRAISPVIFCSEFQNTANPEKRRRQGIHYTDEKNILKVIGPLFLDALREEFDDIMSHNTEHRKKLESFLWKISQLTFLDPACGGGNFLVVTYQQLRQLEKSVMQKLNQERQREETGPDFLQYHRVHPGQFYGIELEELPARMAVLSLCLTDWQMNPQRKERSDFDLNYSLSPTFPTIVCSDALTLDWETVIPKTKLNYILGNPPYVGFTYMNKNQKAAMVRLFPECGVLDYVTAWFRKAAEYIQGTEIEVGFVATNSICQGESVAPLWNLLFHQYGVVINFAHQSFQWSGSNRTAAGVYCVIIGFSLCDCGKKRLFLYEKATGEPKEISVGQINAYLTDAPNIIVTSRNTALCDVPPMLYGNKPVDGGNLLIKEKEYADFIAGEPGALKYIKKYYGADEFINGRFRYCLWLTGVDSEELRKMPLVQERIDRCRQRRLNSIDAGTRKLTETPAIFRDTNNPDSALLIPCHSSESRRYLPIGFIQKDVISSNANFIIPGATVYHFGILTSVMHMAWMRYVCGRLKSDYRYSRDLVYNNFPWPKGTEEQKSAIKKAAQLVLETRLHFPGASLRELYDPDTMPKELLQAHEHLDQRAERCYRKEKFTSDAERVAFLLEQYLHYKAPNR